MNLSETLYRAANHIAVYGKATGAATADPRNREKSPACAIGAISLFVECEDEYRFARDFVLDHIGHIEGMSTGLALSRWSDRNTAHRVVQVLRGAADTAKRAEPRIPVQASR